MPEKFLRRRHLSGPNLTTTSSPIFYSIPWSPLDYSVTGLGPGQSIRLNNFEIESYNKQKHRCPSETPLDYSKSGFTFYRDTKCTCGFLSEYRKQFNELKYKQWTSPTNKPWWYGRELTSKFDPKHPCYSTHMQTRSTYGQDYRGLPGQPSKLCYPEGEIEKAERLLEEKNRNKPCCGIHCDC